MNGSLSEFDLRQGALPVMLDDRDEVGLIPVRGAGIRTETWVAFTQQHNNLQLFPTTILSTLAEIDGKEIVKVVPVNRRVRGGTIQGSVYPSRYNRNDIVKNCGENPWVRSELLRSNHGAAEIHHRTLPIMRQPLALLRMTGSCCRFSPSNTSRLS